jgi:N-acetylmuramidase/Putative peptidoglycan binding domain
MKTGSIMGRPLDGGDVTAAAKRLGVTEAHVRTVISVEAAGSGFLGKYENDPRLPKILFEAHVFSRETGGKYDASHPQLSSPQWNRALYSGGIKEYDRLREAAKLDFKAAHRAASWGLFQIMGFNHPTAGYDNLFDFIGAQYVSEGLQLQCGINFILSSGLEKFLLLEDWRGFAKGYNGPAYEENQYHEKLAAAYARFKTETVEHNAGIKDIQSALNRAGFNLTVDGIMGSRTEAALREFQANNGMDVNGICGPETREALGLQ